MPTLRTSPIYTDNPGAIPATYVVPGTLELVVQSIVARFDGAGASAAFVPCLSIYTQDGRLVTRVRPDQEFAVGDTGVVTWAPFLRRRPATGPPGSAIELAYTDRDTTVDCTATTESAADVILTAPAVTLDGSTVVMCHFFTPTFSHSLTIGRADVTLFEDGVAVGIMCRATSHINGFIGNVPLYGVTRLTPAAGSHTYSARGWINTGGGTFRVGPTAPLPSGNRPTFLQIVQISS